MSGFSFSKITIVQSLESSEIQTGTELKSYLDGLAEDQATFPEVELVNVADREDFLVTMDRLSDEAEAKDIAPILHLELHGWDDKTGLAFPDDSSLSWSDLADPLVRLNRATQFNLFVCVGACFGAHFLGALRPLHASPCCSLLGPSHEVSPSELMGSFRQFYRELLTSFDGDSAFAAAQKFRFDSGSLVMEMADRWFFKVVYGYLEGQCTKDRLIQRAMKGIADLRNSTGKSIDIEVGVAMQVNQAVSFLDRAFDVYFMTKEVPVNGGRFEAALLEAKASALEFFRAQGIEIV